MNRLTLLRGLMRFGAWLPLARLIVDALNQNLTVNPIQAATQRTGDTAIMLLGLSLLCSPLSVYFKWSDARALRRPLGLYAFLYAAIHVGLFVGVDFGFQFDLIAREFVEKRYLWMGLPAFIILLALAATSFRRAMKRLGQRWKKLHRLIYPGALLVALHLAFVVKGNFFTLSGDVWKPLVATITLGLLLIVRVPPIRRALLARRSTLRPTPRLIEPGRVKD